MAQDPKATVPYDQTQQRTTKRAPKTTHQSREEIKTLFVRGLPIDIREREIHNLFRFFFGYEGCILNENSSKQPVAFVSFTEREFALRAMRYLQDVRLDLNSPQTLRIDFAKSNSKTKRLSPRDLFPAEKRRIVPPIVSSAPYYPPPYAQYNTPNYGMNPLPSLIPWFRQNMSVRDSPMHLSPSFSSPSFTSPPSKVPPCSTLFVANLHPDVPERDLVRLFKTMAGFQRLKMSQKDGAPISFVEYADITSSTNALHAFQGFMVGPTQIRIEYARARMGESKRQRENYIEDQNSQDGHKNQINKLPPQSHIPIDDDNDVDGTNEYDSLGSEHIVGTNHHYSQE